jgi:hypothetical protein
MPMPVSLTVTTTWESTRSRRYLHPAASLGKFHGIREQIPHDLLETFWIAGHRAWLGIHDHLETDAPRLGRRSHRVYGPPNDVRQFDELHVQPDFTRDDARHIEHVLDNLRQRRGIPRHSVQCLVLFLVSE